MIGKNLAHYQITGHLGSGGMGEVYRAHDPRTGRDVAIKVLPKSFASDAERLARFQREARMLASLNHRNIAALYGVEEEGGQPFLVMEVAEGTDLAQRIAAGPMPLDDAIELALQMAEAIEEAHEKGVVHRDLKPANVVVDADGLVKVLDFGLARAYAGDEVMGEDDLADSPTITAAMTQAGTILGTAAYMSPEQARGRGIDRRSDLWAFGVILWEMLSGQRLFAGETVSDTIAGVLKGEIDWDQLPAGTPRGVRRLLERCLERDVRNRLRDIGEARIRLQRWKADPSSLDESFGTAELKIGESRNRSWIPWTIAALSAATALFFALRPAPEVAIGGSDFVSTIRLEDEERMSNDSYEALIVSPDGQYVAWSTDHGLYLRQRSSLEAQFTQTDSKTTSAAFSPDSRWIAYAHSGKLFRQSVTGGAAIEICEVAAGRGLSWVDAETIVMSADYAAPLSIISVSDGSIRDLTQLEQQERSHRWPFAIPGTREVLFMTQIPGRDYQDSDIEALDLDSGRRRIIHRGGANPRYSPTGHLLFARGNTILAVSYTPGDAATSGIATPILAGVMTSVGDQELDDGSVQYGFDQRGNLIYRIAASRTDLESQMAWLELPTGEITPFGLPGHYTRPVISPDGTQVVVRRGVGNRSQIVVHDLQTGADLALTSERITKYPAAWSADGEHVYWPQPNPTASAFQITRAPRDGSRPPEALFVHPHSIFVDEATKDGKRLFLTYFLPESSYDLGYIELGAEEPALQEYFGGPREQTTMDLSPDNSLALTAEGPSGNGEIYVRRYPDTGARWKVLETSTDNIETHWSADGGRLYECTETGLRAIPIEQRGESVVVGRPQLLHEPGWLMRADAGDVDVHPDGQRLLILLPQGAAPDETPASIVWKTGWFDELRRLTGSN